MSELKRWKVNLDDDYGFHGLERSGGPVLEGMKEVSMGDCELMLAHEVDVKFSALTEKVVRLEGELAISKGREEGKQLVINQLEGENIAALTRLGVQAIQYQLEINKLKAECERLRQDAKAMVDVVRGNQLTKELKPWTR